MKISFPKKNHSSLLLTVAAALLVFPHAVHAESCLETVAADIDLADLEGNCDFDDDIRPFIVELLDEYECDTSWRSEIRAWTGIRNLNRAKAEVVEACLEAHHDDTGGGGGDTSEEACLTLADLDLESARMCAPFHLEELLERKLRPTQCTHGMEEELLFLSGEDNYEDAMYWLHQECYHAYGCSTYFDEGFVLEECTLDALLQGIEEQMEEAWDCPHDLDREIQILTGESNVDAAENALTLLCHRAYNDADKIPTTGFASDIDARFTRVFMERFMDGGTFLNTETGNFQGPENEGYPVSDQSYSAGRNIADYHDGIDREHGAQTSKLKANFDNFAHCENQVAMCCWGRDRQSDDDNGNCNNGPGECEPDQANPADNTNLCNTNPSCTPYPDETEDDAHCHGFAWAEDSNDLISQLKINNFFYVSQFDHLYQRGYVEPIVRNGVDYVPMCGCIETMPPVSRSDCTQIDAVYHIRVFRNGNHRLVVEPRDDVDHVVEIEFNACQGFDPSVGLETGELIDEENDLASYVYRLVLEEKLDEGLMWNAFETLVGYEEPNDNENEEACHRHYCDTCGDLAGLFDPTYTCPYEDRRRLRH